MSRLYSLADPGTTEYELVDPGIGAWDTVFDGREAAGEGTRRGEGGDEGYLYGGPRIEPGHILSGPINCNYMAHMLISPLIIIPQTCPTGVDKGLVRQVST